MDRYRGDFDGLKKIVSDLGYVGEWSDVANAKQFLSDDGAILNWFSTTGTLTCQGPAEPKNRLEEAVDDALSGGTGTPSSPASRTVQPTASTTRSPAPAPVAETERRQEIKVFVVHGHDTVAREQLERVLLLLKLDPFVLQDTGGGGLTIIEALEREIGQDPSDVRFGIVLMTPDDMGYSNDEGPDHVQPRARQNVVMEMGMLMSAIGRRNVAVLKKGNVDVPSEPTA